VCNGTHPHVVLKKLSCDHIYFFEDGETLPQIISWVAEP
jgi:hypothetical protein